MIKAEVRYIDENAEIPNNRESVMEIWLKLPDDVKNYAFYADPVHPAPMVGDWMEVEEHGGHHAYWTRPGDAFRITLRKRDYMHDPMAHDFH